MKILVADDNESFRLMLGAKLEQLGHEVTLAADGNDAADELARTQYAVLISDWMMPGIDGPELCRRARADQSAPYVYIILITSRVAFHDYRDGIEAGADDFLNKPFDAEHLEARLHAASRMLAMHQELRERALVDGLTGLLNRGAIVDGLNQELHRAAREKRGLAVFLVDVDHFKHVNDSLGHPAGDAVLKETARRMKKCFRPYDRVGRYGGEEFLLVAPCVNSAQAERLAERLRKAIANAPIKTAGKSVGVTVSIGVLAVSADDMTNPQDLIAVADAALYRAKNSGRNRVEFVDYLAPEARKRA